MPRTGGHYISMPSRVCATDAPARPTGRSRGERLALRCSDVDLTNSILRVRGTLSRANGHLVISEPKTERSPRNVPLSPATVALMGGSRRAKQSSGSRRPRSWLRRASSSPRGAEQQSTLGGTAGDQRQPRLWGTASVCTRCSTDLPRICSWRGCHCISSRSSLHRRRAPSSSGSQQQMGW